MYGARQKKTGKSVILRACRRGLAREPPPALHNGERNIIPVMWCST
jgi:hypothetical protein